MNRFVAFVLLLIALGIAGSNFAVYYLDHTLINAVFYGIWSFNAGLIAPFMFKKEDRWTK